MAKELEIIKNSILEILLEIKKDSYIGKFMPMFLTLWFKDIDNKADYNIKSKDFADPNIRKLFDLIYPHKNLINHLDFCLLMIEASEKNPDLLDYWITWGEPLRNLRW